MSRTIVMLAAAVGIASLAALSPAPAGETGPETIAKVLDDFHDAASKADGARYFGHFAPNGVFIGTDVHERWTLEQFQGYAKPYFDKGQGWTYVPRQKDRHIDVSADGSVAWFDEMLDNAKYGLTRGSGVLIRDKDTWRIAQYNLSVPIPNDLLPAVVEMIRKQPAK